MNSCETLFDIDQDSFELRVADGNGSFPYQSFLIGLNHLVFHLCFPVTIEKCC